MRRYLWGFCLVFGGAVSGFPSTLDFGGTIIQSTADGTGPATSNPGLNNIQDGQAYTVSLIFPGAITGPGTYHATSAIFTVAAAPATETSFATITLTVMPDGAFLDFSLLACLTSGGGCASGNELDANFQIPATSIGLSGVTATGLDQPHPLDLLEDMDTDTPVDIHGTIGQYSCEGCSSTAAPEPISLVTAGGAILGLLAVVSRGSRHARRQICKSFSEDE